MSRRICSGGRSLPYSDRGQGHWRQASESMCNHYWKAAKSKR